MHKIVGADAHIRPFLQHHNFLQRDDVGIVPYKKTVPQTVFLTVRALSVFESLRCFLHKKSTLLSQSAFMVHLQGHSRILRLDCLTTQAYGFGTRLRTTHLKTVPQTVFLTARALSVFESLQDNCKKNKANTQKGICFIYGAPSGTRTRDPLIKSQLLYQLS